jgi:hypothetical protein
MLSEVALDVTPSAVTPAGGQRGSGHLAGLAVTDPGHCAG